MPTQVPWRKTGLHLPASWWMWLVGAGLVLAMALVAPFVLETHDEVVIAAILRGDLGPEAEVPYQFAWGWREALRGLYHLAPTLPWVGLWILAEQVAVAALLVQLMRRWFAPSVWGLVAAGAVSLCLLVWLGWQLNLARSTPLLVGLLVLNWAYAPQPGRYKRLLRLALLFAVGCIRADAAVLGLGASTAVVWLLVPSTRTWRFGLPPVGAVVALVGLMGSAGQSLGPHHTQLRIQADFGTCRLADLPNFTPADSTVLRAIEAFQYADPALDHQPLLRKLAAHCSPIPAWGTPVMWGRLASLQDFLHAQIRFAAIWLVLAALAIRGAKARLRWLLASLLAGALAIGLALASTWLTKFVARASTPLALLLLLGQVQAAHRAGWRPLPMRWVALGLALLAVGILGYKARQAPPPLAPQLPAGQPLLLTIGGMNAWRMPILQDNPLPHGPHHAVLSSWPAVLSRQQMLREQQTYPEWLDSLGRTHQLLATPVEVAILEAYLQNTAGARLVVQSTSAPLYPSPIFLEVAPVHLVRYRVEIANPHSMPDTSGP